MLGNMLQGRDQQYVATRDSVTNTWRILDTWHDDLKTLQIEDDVPDDSEAVNILTEGAFIALVKEASRSGVLENAAVPMTDDSEEVESLQQELIEMQEKLVEYEKKNSALAYAKNLSEPFQIKTKAMEAVLKLAAMSDIDHISEA